MKNLRKPWMMIGLSLVELLVALAIGVFLVAGIGTIFVRGNESFRVQTGVARLQENARYGLDAIADDLASVGYQTCSVYNNNNANEPSPRLINYYPTSAVAGISNTGAAGAPIPLDIPQGFYYLRGYECGSSSCSPNLPGAIAARGFGTGLGNLVPGSDVLTIRYLRPGNAVPLIDNMANASAPIPVATPGAFSSGDIALISDCLAANIFEVTGSSAAGVEHAATSNALANLSEEFSGFKAAELVNLSAPGPDGLPPFNAIEYFLAYVQDPTDPTNAAAVVPALFRSDNGVDAVLVEGVDQMDFRFVVDTAAGLQSMTSTQVDAATNGGTNFWPSVIAVEMDIWVNSVSNVQRADQTTVIDGETYTDRRLRRQYSHYAQVRNNQS